MQGGWFLKILSTDTTVPQRGDYQINSVDGKVLLRGASRREALDYVRGCKWSDPEGPELLLCAGYTERAAPVFVEIDIDEERGET